MFIHADIITEHLHDGTATSNLTKEVNSKYEEKKSLWQFEKKNFETLQTCG